MSTNVTTVTNHYPSPQNGFTTTTSGSVGSGAATVGLNSVAGYTNGQIIVLVIDPTDASKKQTFTGVVDTAGVQVTGVKWTAGTNQTHALGATVVDYATATHISMITKGLLSAGLTQAGGMGAITPTSVTSSGTITAANFVQTGGADSSGWTVGFGAPDTVAANGNRSYTLTYNATDKTSVVSAGMRLRTTRTVSAPTQCTDLEASSSQYFSKTSPAGLSFTVTWTGMAWVKLESYTTGGIIARRNVDTEGWTLGVTSSGQLNAQSLRIAANNSVTTAYQSLPLNKWVHVAAAVDLAGTTLLYMDGVLIPSATVVTGTAATLVQGTTALVVGAEKSAGTNPFDGKIAQAAVFSSKLSAATIASYMSQTLSGSESTNVSAFSLNNTLNDLNANANNLTANGAAVATNADSPFGTQASGLISATLDYGIIQSVTFSTNTTVVVQVPEGCTIPTSGGVSAVSYSTQKAPYGFPAQRGKWEITATHASAFATVSISSPNQWFSLNTQLTVPIGDMELGYEMVIVGTGAINIQQWSTLLAPATPTNGIRTSELVAGDYNVNATQTAVLRTMSRKSNVSLSVATPYLFYGEVIVNSGATTLAIRGDLGLSVIKAVPANL